LKNKKGDVFGTQCRFLKHVPSWAPNSHGVAGSLHEVVLVTFNYVTVVAGNNLCIVLSRVKL